MVSNPQTWDITICWCQNDTALRRQMKHTCFKRNIFLEGWAGGFRLALCHHLVPWGTDRPQGPPRLQWDAYSTAALLETIGYILAVLVARKQELPTGESVLPGTSGASSSSRKGACKAVDLWISVPFLWASLRQEVTVAGTAATKDNEATIGKRTMFWQPSIKRGWLRAIRCPGGGSCWSGYGCKYWFWRLLWLSNYG